MIQRLIELCARNRFLVLALVAVAAAWGWVALQRVQIDAIPDLSDTQVIVFSRWERSPDIIEDQVTYPIVTTLLGAPQVKNIRGISDFGFSYVYVIFEDGTDLYWARSRVLEYLSKITPELPEGVQTELGPDATGVGWVYQYALVDQTGERSLADLRTLQDWYLRFHLQAVPGIAEVASVGGFEKQYQIEIDPTALFSYQVPLQAVANAVRRNNNEVGARVLEVADTEYMIRGRGYIKGVNDIEDIVVTERNGTPIFIKNIARVTTGPEIRRGVADLDGIGDTVGGIIIMRHGENANEVIARVKDRLRELEPTLPDGVEIVTAYDRSDLIHRAIDTLKHELTLEMIIVSIVIIAFLLHLPSALVPIITLPLAVLISFIPIYLLGISSNIMSLGGIAIAIGAMVDAAIVLVENVHKHLERWKADGKRENQGEVIIRAAKEVGPASFYSLLVIAVSFVPVFALEAQEGRLFKPLAYTKNLSMLVAALLSITLAPALLMTLMRLRKRTFRPLWVSRLWNRVFIGKLHSEEEHPISRFLFRIYGPAVDWVVDHRGKVIIAAIIIMAATVPIYFKLGSEFMPPLNEGDILYMPTTTPGLSTRAAQNLLQRQDQVLKTFPEVETVFGKAGRADTPTDPAPLSMFETIVQLKPQEQWRRKERWYSDLPEALQRPFRWIWPDSISWDELISEMDAKTKFPGVTNSWTMPIRNRIDMLTTGVRTPVGIKVLGSDLKRVQEAAVALESVLPRVEGTRSVFAERVAEGYFLDFDFNRKNLARYGIDIETAQEVLMLAVGGAPVTKTVEGRERYTVQVRYARDFRSNLDDLKRVLVAAPDGTQVPMGQLADIRFRQGPAMIRDENGMLASYVFVDIAGRDIGGYVEEAKQFVLDNVPLPPGVALVWSGQYEYLLRARETLKLVVPVTLLLIVFLLYANTRSWVKTGIILTAVPFSAVGAFWLLYLLDFNMSIAVWVGLIALLGVDAEMGIFMLLYLDLAYEERRRVGRMNSFSDLKDAIHEGAVKRVRPKVMTAACLFMALMPILLASSAKAGADVMKRIAAPMVGGIATSFVLELLVYPAIFAIWKWRFEMRRARPEELP